MPETETLEATETAGEESQEGDQWGQGVLNLSTLTRPGASLPQLTKAEMGLLHKLLLGGSQKPGETLGLDFLRTGYFEDEEAAFNFAAAFIEAREIGIPTDYHLAAFNSMCSVNRRGLWANLMGLLTDTLQHAKFAGAGNQQMMRRGYGNSNTSPLR